MSTKQALKIVTSKKTQPPAKVKEANDKIREVSKRGPRGPMDLVNHTETFKDGQAVAIWDRGEKGTGYQWIDGFKFAGYVGEPAKANFVNVTDGDETFRCGAKFVASIDVARRARKAKEE